MIEALNKSVHNESSPALAATPSATDPPPRWAFGVLAAIVAVAAFLRFWGITYGLPNIYYPDEGLTIYRALGMGTGDLNPHFFEYPALMMYFLAFFYGLSFVVAYIVGWVGSVRDFAFAFVKDPTYFFLSARTIVAVLGIGTVGLTYALGRRLFDWRIGLAAAALLAVHPVHTDFSHFVKMEGPQSFFVLLALLAALPLLERESLKQYLLAGGLAGICTALKYPGCLTFASIFAAHLIRNWATRPRWRLLFDRRLWLSFVAMLAVFLATNPFVILDFPRFWFDLTYQANVSNVRWVGYKEGSLWDWVSASAGVQGYVITFALFIGVVYFAIKRKPAHWVVLAFLLVCLPILCGQKLHQVHWLMPLFGCMMIFAAGFLWEIVGAVIRPAGARTLVWIGLIAIGLVKMTPQSIAEDHHFTLPDTRTQARAWIEQNIPKDSMILMDRGRFIAGYTAPILPNGPTIERLYLANESAQGGVKEPSEIHASLYFRLMIEATKDKTTYNIIPIVHDAHGGQTKKRQRPPVEPLDDYIKQGVQYIVVSSAYKDRYFVPNQSPENARYSRPFVEFYESVKRRCRLLKEFVGEPGKVQGPAIRVYKVPQP